MLAASAQTKAQWEDLTPIARQDFVSWIDPVKQTETPKRRVESVPSRLASGKRRPCWYAIVPTNLCHMLSAPVAPAPMMMRHHRRLQQFDVVTDACERGLDARQRDAHLTNGSVS